MAESSLLAPTISIDALTPGPSALLRDSHTYTPSERRNRSAGSGGTRHQLSRSRSSLESIQKKRARQGQQLDQAPLQPKSGQQFRVGNVTSNGRLQLRPVTRENNNSYSSPPLTPPFNSATQAIRYEVPEDWDGSVLSRSTDAPTIIDRSTGRNASQPPNKSSIPPSRARSHSFSTMDDPVEPDRRNPADVKLLINNTSPSKTQTRTATGRSMDLLEISIPHYRLGTPHFTGKGSAVLHSSINTGSSITDGFRSSALSGQEYDRMFPQPPKAYQRLPTNIGPRLSNTYYLSVDGAASQRRTIPSDLITSHNPRGLAVEPTVLLELEASPLNQNSRSIVRLSRVSGQILAATPSGLIAQITSPNLLDYDLLSDFFLTFRAYLTTHQLVGFLITRLQWAVSRSDDFGRIVRVRTFVALRHWILNYFVDDFVSDYGLRSEFCNLANDLCTELQTRVDGGVGDLKILGELKKCWRRTCGLYWDVPEHKSERPIDPVLPGGRLGSRTSSVREAQNQAILGQKEYPSDSAPGVTLAEPNVGQQGGRANGRPTSSMLQGKAIITHHTPNRASDQSTHVVSCSITFKSTANPSNKAERSVGARPVAPPLDPAPSTAKLSPGLRKNPPPYHRRTGSFSDALRDSRANVLEASVRRKGPVVTSSHAFSGSLVRGVLIEPASPYVESLAPESPVNEKPGFDFKFAGQNEITNLEDRHQTGTSPGMRKFFGNVRRALSTRQNTSLKTVNNKPSPRLSNIPISAVSSSGPSGPPKRKLVGGQARPRVDLLAVAASESFYKLAKEEANADGCDHLAEITAQSGQLAPSSPGVHHLSASAPPESNRLNSNVTMGSRSIYIVDDTGDYSFNPQRPFTQESRPVKSLDIYSDGASSHGNRQTIAIGVEPESPMANKLLELAVAGLVTPPPSSASPHSQAVQIDPADATRTSRLHQSLPEATSSTENARDTRDTQTTTADAFHYDRQPHLRRRPGGDLRAVDHVHSLGESASQRSLRSNTTDSQLSPGMSQTTTEQPHAAVEDPQTQTRKNISIIETQSSQPIGRPSFEKEVAKLAQIPDDADDGGIESTLRKLEGYLETSDASPFDDELPPSIDGRELARKMLENTAGAGHNTSQGLALHSHREEEVYAGGVVNPPATYEEDTDVGESDTVLSPEAGGENMRVPSVASVADSNASYSSTPLLERGLSFAPPKNRHSSSDWLKVSLPKSPASPLPQDSAPFQRFDDHSDQGPREGSVDSLEQISRDANLQSTSEAHESFLLDDNQSLTGVVLDNSGVQIQPVDLAKQSRSFLHDDNDTLITNGGQAIPLHTLRHPVTPPGGKTSPFAVRRPVDIPGPSLAGHITQQDRDAFSARSSNSRVARSKNAIELGEMAAQPAFAGIPGAAHIPFILGFDSLLLAQQFTLVEKDALSEIDWRQLIDLRWNTNAKTCRTWADCIKPRMNDNKEPRFLGGVDICITRFNIVVKWAASEVILCQDMADRVACIVKYIHIACHARQLRNWATMFQITMALVSGDVSRLKDTWLEVPMKERDYLKTLENLIMPMRNFHNLRAEMELAIANPPAPGTDGGCIPFIGIYTHDLIYNAQKPLFAQQPEGIDTAEPLVNFERHRTAATIVKSLLRLIDASSKYSFQPVPDVLSRCLWMATLEDEDISRRSKTLES